MLTCTLARIVKIGASRKNTRFRRGGSLRFAMFLALAPASESQINSGGPMAMGPIAANAGGKSDPRNFSAMVCFRHRDGSATPVPTGALIWKLSSDRSSAPAQLQETKIAHGVGRITSGDAKNCVPAFVRIDGVEVRPVDIESDGSATNFGEYVVYLNAVDERRIRLFDDASGRELDGSVKVISVRSGGRFQNPGSLEIVSSQELNLPISIDDLSPAFESSSRIFVSKTGFCWAAIDISSLVDEQCMIVEPGMDLEVIGLGAGEFAKPPTASRVVVRRSGELFGQWSVDMAAGPRGELRSLLRGLPNGDYSIAIECQSALDSKWKCAAQMSIVINADKLNRNDTLPLDLHDTSTAEVSGAVVEVRLAREWRINRPVLRAQCLADPQFDFFFGIGDADLTGPDVYRWRIDSLLAGKYVFSIERDDGRSVVPIHVYQYDEIGAHKPGVIGFEIPRPCKIRCELKPKDARSVGAYTNFTVSWTWTPTRQDTKVPLEWRGRRGWQIFDVSKSASFEIECPIGFLDISCKGAGWTATQRVECASGELETVSLVPTVVK